MTSPAYMLDTNICIDIVGGQVRGARSRLAAIPPADVAISAIVRAELLEGLLDYAPTHNLVAATRDFLAAVVTLPWEARFADQFAQVRHRLRRQGNRIEDMDILIAAHAIAIDAILVTNNVRHFERLALDLEIEDWVAPTT